MKSPKLSKDEKEVLKAGGCFAMVLYSFKIMVISSCVLIYFLLLFLSESKNNTNEEPFIVDAYTTINSDLDGKLVALTGKLEIEAELNESAFQGLEIIYLYKKIEMYALHKKVKAVNLKDLNSSGSSDIDSTYSYYKAWTENPQRSSSFSKGGEQLQNPKMDVVSNLFTANVKLGNYTIDIDDLYNSASAESSELFKLETAFKYKGSGILQEPEVGDIKTTYTYFKLPKNNLTIVGRYNASRKNLKYYSIFTEENNHDLTKTMQKAYSDKKEDKMQWHMKIIGFIAIWICMYLVVSPITLFYDVIPILKKRMPVVEDIIETGILTTILVFFMVGISKLFPGLTNSIAYFLIKIFDGIFKTIF